MPNSRRRFMSASLSLLGAATTSSVLAQTEPPPGTPPAFGTGPQVGPEVSFNTFKEAEKLVQVEFSERNLEQAAFSWRRSMAWLWILLVLIIVGGLVYYFVYYRNGTV